MTNGSPITAPVFDSGAFAVTLQTFTDADYAQTFRVQLGNTIPPVYQNFTGYTMEMMVRAHPEDVEVFLAITSSSTGMAPGQSGIDIYDPGTETTAGLWEFAVIIFREQLQKIPEGTYAQSLIATGPDGFRRDIWRGDLINTIGPTR